eukprot:5157559-Heterocapsa_arctica.AAC.1
MPSVVTDMCDRNKRRSEGRVVCQPTRVEADRTICRIAEASADAGPASCLLTDAGGGTTDASALRPEGTDACVAPTVQRGCVGRADNSVAEGRSRNDSRHYSEDT